MTGEKRQSQDKVFMSLVREEQEEGGDEEATTG